jgi:hypothetical protein
LIGPIPEQHQCRDDHDHRGDQKFDDIAHDETSEPEAARVGAGAGSDYAHDEE